MATAFFFYLFSVLAMASGAAVVFAKNPVHAVLFLILTFFNAAGLFVLLDAEFLCFGFLRSAYARVVKRGDVVVIAFTTAVEVAVARRHTPPSPSFRSPPTRRALSSR